MTMLEMQLLSTLGKMGPISVAAMMDEVSKSRKAC